jgi:hypothetical protein
LNVFEDFYIYILITSIIVALPLALVYFFSHIKYYKYSKRNLILKKINIFSVALCTTASVGYYIIDLISTIYEYFVNHKSFNKYLIFFAIPTFIAICFSFDTITTIFSEKGEKKNNHNDIERVDCRKCLKNDRSTMKICVESCTFLKEILKNNNIEIIN